MGKWHVLLLMPNKGRRPDEWIRIGVYETREEADASCRYWARDKDVAIVCTDPDMPGFGIDGLWVKKSHFSEGLQKWV